MSEPEDARRERDGYRWHLRECEQIAGKALGYPWYKDDPSTFPGATEADGVCIGEHVGDTIVAELASTFAAVKAERERMREALTAAQGVLQQIIDPAKFATSSLQVWAQAIAAETAICAILK
jgi:hypothetical protein